MAEEGRSNERHEVMTYSKVINDAILAADLMSGIGQQGDDVRVLWNYLAWASRDFFLKIQLKKLGKIIQFCFFFSRYPVWV